jgi:hypothetical protein
MTSVPEAPTTHTPPPAARKPPAQDGPIMGLAGFAPAEVGLSPADLAALDLLTLERLHLAHALLDDAALPARLRLPPELRRPLLDHALGLLGPDPEADIQEAGEPSGPGIVPWPGPRLGPDPDPGHPDAELLALGAEMGLLGEVLRTWPDDATAEQADARLEQVELRIAALVPRTGAGLAVKLRLACALWAGGEPIEPGDGGPAPDGDERARLLWRLVDEAEALDAALPRDVSCG